MMDVSTMRAARGIGAAAVVAAELLVGGCRRPQVRTEPAPPALDMPTPPPRDVEPTDLQVPPLVPLIDVPPRTVERPLTPAPVTRDPGRSEPRPESPTEPLKPVEEPRPATTLQTASTEQEAELDRRVRATLQTAGTDLNRIDYRRLNPDEQHQYDTVKSFIRQAEDALRDKNLVFAQTMAEKAATLAKQLPAR